MKKLLTLTLVVSLLLTCLLSPVSVNAAATNEKFLIIVSNPLLRASNGSQLQQALDQYKIDLTNEGWVPAQVNVNNIQDGSAQRVCSTPAQLKAMIREYFNNGYTGFIMIGSHPAIQTAWFKDKSNTIANTTSGDYADPCDIYYADMNTTWTVNGDLVSPPLDASNNYNFSTIAPEMFFGRVYIRGAVIRQPNNTYDTIDNDYKECREVIRYLNKVHGFRAGTGPSLTNEEESSYYIHGDNTKAELNSFINSQFTNVTLNYDPARSNDEYLFDTLNNQGFKVAFINSHGFTNGHAFVNSAMMYGYIQPGGSYMYITSDKVRKLNVKSRLIHLFPCSSSRYISYNSSTNGVNEDCLGKAYIYNSDYVLNIFGDLAPSNLYYPGYYPNLYNDVTNICVGKAAQNWLTANASPSIMQATVTGDPTIEYRKIKTATSAIPVITNYLQNPEVKAGSLLSLPINIKDTDSASVNIQIDGLPNTSTITASVPITNSAGTYNLNWTAPSDAAGKYFNFTIKLSDSQGNKCEERLKLYVSDFNNGMLLNSASGWTVEGSGYQLNDSTVEPLSIAGTKPAEINLTNGYATISQNLILEPNRDYRLIYYGVNGLTAPYRANVSIANQSNDIVTGSFSDFYYKDRYINFNSGYSGKVTCKITAGTQVAPVNGKLTLSGFKLVPLYWNMFNMTEDASSYTWQYEDSTKWTYEKGELSSEAGEGIKALLSSQSYKNLSVEGDITVSNSTTYSDAGIVLRATNIGAGPDNFKGYAVVIDAFNKAVKLGRFNNNTATLVGNYLMNILPNKKYHVKAEAIENVIKVYVDDMKNPVIVYTDTNADRDQLLAAGQVGFRNYRTHAHFDNFEINGASAPLYWDDFNTATPGVIPARLGTIPGENGFSWSVNNMKLRAFAGEGIKAIIKEENSSAFDTYGDFTMRTKVNVANGTTYSGAGIMFRASNISAGADMFTGYSVSVDAFNKAISLWKFKNNCKILANYPMNVQAGVDYDLKIDATGNNIKIYVNNMTTPVINFTDNEADKADYAQGSIGFRTYRTDVTYDDVNVTGK
ncbi:MAG: DUF1080 domain-containing protein [Clostridia bacterium]|nr:DUF1080 domain-containing protein [Clostridia bacterium]